MEKTYAQKRTMTTHLHQWQKRWRKPSDQRKRSKSMRKIIVYNVISLDGYHTGAGNDVSVMFPMMGKVFDTYNAELLRTADLFLVGRVSFELFQSFWPKVAENPDSEEWTPEQRELVQAGESVNTIVVSDTLTGNWPDIRIIRRADAYQQIAELKRQTGKDILMTGSRTLWNDLLAHDLVDEIHLMIGNLVLGEGVPVFVGKTPASLRLIDIRRWEDSDNVLLRYEVRHKSVYGPTHAQASHVSTMRLRISASCERQAARR
jgi:dihydrofolate reductase